VNQSAGRILKSVAYRQSRQRQQKARGRIVDNQENLAVIAQPVMPALPVVEQKGFTIEDILWAIGIWSVLLTMSPVVVFYMLMVA
jgi:hypothetical protein